MSEILTRMGNGYTVAMSPDEVRTDIVAGSEDAARRGKTMELGHPDYSFKPVEAGRL